MEMIAPSHTVDSQSPGCCRRLQGFITSASLLPCLSRAHVWKQSYMGEYKKKREKKGQKKAHPTTVDSAGFSLFLSLHRTLCNHISTLKISPLHFFVHLFSHLWKVHNISSLKGAVHTSFWSQTITLICYYNCSVVGCSGIGGCFLLVWLWLPQAHTIISLHSTYHYLVMYWFVVGYLVKNVCVCPSDLWDWPFLYFLLFKMNRSWNMHMNPHWKFSFKFLFFKETLHSSPT